MIAIMVDSAAGISRQEAEQLGAHYVPMTYTVDRQQFVEHYIGENGQFEPYIERDDVERRTSQASASAFITAFERQLAKGRQVLCITISSRLSGTYANAVMENPVHAVASLYRRKRFICTGHFSSDGKIDARMDKRSNQPGDGVAPI